MLIACRTAPISARYQGPVTLTTAPVAAALPAGEAQMTVTVLFGPDWTGTELVSVQSILLSRGDSLG